ncbi:MAG: hypothetical protein C0602_05405 [Denitrovibrio sp.]|nr:MAG: hypothetical protein C0602_05405 [Denitrovibrio sp.]
MANQGQKEKAYNNLSSLCSKFPDDKRFCVEAMTVKQDIYLENISFVKEKLDGGGLLSESTLNAVDEKLKKAMKYETGTSESYKYSLKLQSAEKATESAVKAALTSSAQAALASDFFTAYSEISAVKSLAPAKLGKLEEEYARKAIDSNMEKAEKLIAEDNLKEAKELLAKMASIDPENKKIIEYMSQAQKNDNPDFYIAKGNGLKESGELDKAMDYYKKALSFPDARQEAQRAIDETRVQLIEISFMQGIEYADQDLIKQAYDNFISAFTNMKGLPLEIRTMVSIPKDELEQYYDNMFYLGQRAMDEGAYGQSYLYFSMLYDLAPSYYGLRSVKQSVEDKILSRALKSIAVIPFKSPVNEPELGLQVTSNIMQILQNTLNDDVKIIERGALEILLREYELAVAGNIAEQQSNPDSFRIKSADFLLMGEVLDSRTETNVQNSKKKVRVKVSENKVRNIEWEDWSKDAEKLRKDKKPVPPEPDKYIMKPIYEYAEYDVAFHEKVSYLSISYRVVETSQGRVTYSNTVRAQKESRDEATSGIDIGDYKIEMKAANLPTDIELSNVVRKEAIDTISSQVMNLFKDQDERYLTEAEKLEASNNLREAVEMYVNAILLKKRKNKDVAEIEDKAGKYLDVLSIY